MIVNVLINTLGRYWSDGQRDRCMNGWMNGCIPIPSDVSRILVELRRKEEVMNLCSLIPCMKYAKLNIARRMNENEFWKVMHFSDCIMDFTSVMSMIYFITFCRDMLYTLHSRQTIRVASEMLHDMVQICGRPLYIMYACGKECACNGT